ncbi:hypothetical protein [Methylobacterium flocculans]|uniref:hypothetical protein n=1 Tax=Methylobacterium flocculans TaxID=2984843 RepID=UPI0021F2F62A|nr:hypothetical protein [Methylobacterium sp. FF17]
MHPSPDEPSADPRLREFTKACQVVSMLSHPDTRPIAEAALQALRVAVATRSIRTSTVKGLRQSIRKHVRAAWTDGVVVPLARSRDPADRAVLQRLPMDLDLKAHRSVTDVLVSVAGMLPEQAHGTRRHVDLGLRYLRNLPVILGALDDLDTFVGEAPPRTATPPGKEEEDHVQALATATRRLRAEFAKVLPLLVGGLAEAAHRLPPADFQQGSMPTVAGILCARPVHGGRAADPERTGWRRRLSEALLHDIVDGGLRPELARLLRRHHGLVVGRASCSLGHDHEGALGLCMTRGAVTLRLAVGFAVMTGRMDLVHAVGPDAASRRAGAAEVDAILDDSTPAYLDTPAHRAMRRLAAACRESFSMSRSEDGELVVAERSRAPIDADLVGMLVGIADEEGVAVRFMALRDTALATALIDSGFTRPDDRSRGILRRAPAAPAAALGP